MVLHVSVEDYMCVNGIVYMHVLLMYVYVGFRGSGVESEAQFGTTRSWEILGFS